MQGDVGRDPPQPPVPNYPTTRYSTGRLNALSIVSQSRMTDPIRLKRSYEVRESRGITSMEELSFVVETSLY